MPLTMQQTTFKNFIPGDHIKSKKGEIFQVKERLTYFCKKCECKAFNPCEEMKRMTTLILESQRGTWEMTLEMLNDKYSQGEINLL